MTVFQALVLGVLQGLAEFLPISSSAHLTLAPWLLHWPDPGLAFDVALHFGTLLAVLWYFRAQWLALIRAAASIVAHRRIETEEERRVLYLIVATIPGEPGKASLNLAAAVQVAAYELFLAARGEAVWTAPAFAPAALDEIEELFAHAQRTLIAMRFLNPRQPKRLLPRLRRLFARARLEKEEVNILRGILARIDQLLDRRP